MSNRKLGVLSVLAVAMLVAVCVSPIVTNESDEGTSVADGFEVYLKKNQSWDSSFGFTETLGDATVTIYSGSSAATTSSTFSGTTTGNSDTVYASVAVNNTSHTVTLTVKTGDSAATTWVAVKVTTLCPTQEQIYNYHINVYTPSISYGSASLYNGQTGVSVAPTVSGVPSAATKTTYSISDGTNGASLAANTGLSFDTSTGKITGTVSNATNSAQTYTVVGTSVFVLTSSNTYSQTFNNTVTIGTYASADLAASSQAVILSKAMTAVAAPSTTGITYVLQSASYTLNGGSSTTVTPGTAFNGITVAATSGAVSGTPSATGVYAITENYKVSETGQTCSRTVTVTVENQITASNLDNKATYVGGATVNTEMGKATYSAAYLNNSAQWSITSGNSNGYFQIDSSTGAVTVKSVPAAGTYTLTLKVASKTITANSATCTLKIIVNQNVTVAATATAYAAVGGDYDSLTIAATSGTLQTGSYTYSLSTTDSNLTVGTSGKDMNVDASTGAISFGTSLAKSDVGKHTVTLTVQDSANSDNKATCTVTVDIKDALVLGTPSAGNPSSS